MSCVTFLPIIFACILYNRYFSISWGTLTYCTLHNFKDIPGNTFYVTVFGHVIPLFDRFQLLQLYQLTVFSQLTYLKRALLPYDSATVNISMNGQYFTRNMPFLPYSLPYLFTY